MNKPVLFMSKLGRYLNIFNKRSDNVNINPTVLRMLRALALLTFAVYVIPPAVQLALFLFRQKYYVERMPIQIDGALLKTIAAYILYVSPQILISAAVLLMCSLLNAMASNKTKSTAFQVTMNVVFYSCILYLLYSPFNAFKGIYASSSSLPKSSLVFLAAIELLGLTLIYFTRSSIYLSVLYFNFWTFVKDTFIIFLTTSLATTPERLALTAGRLSSDSFIRKIEDYLQEIERTDIFEEIKQGITAKGYDISRIFAYGNIPKRSLGFAISNNHTDCVLLRNTFIKAYSDKPKSITAALLHEITHIENRDCEALRMITYTLNLGAVILPLVWTIRRAKLRKTVESFLYSFILSKLWVLILSIPFNLYTVYVEFRADRGVIGTGYEEHMIYLLTKMFIRTPKHRFGLDYDITALNWIYFAHPSNLHRVDAIKKNM
ncbi:hypothetical protein ENBRE01_2617 [Enteropsectra breve]|nr:hypothetical protein ENBRE01_2617 [Enteropsectra breve]